MSLAAEGSKVATSVVDVFKTQPALLFLTLVNMAFLVFVYFGANIVKEVYLKQQEQIDGRYAHMITVVDRCMARIDHDMLSSRPDNVGTR